MPRIALYPGSFDPVTNGHLDVVRHAVMLCDRLIVAIGLNSTKKPLFSTDERLDMVRAVFAPVAASAGCAFECTTYDNLTASPAVRPITATLVRQIAGMGGDVSPFVPPAVAAGLKTKFGG